MQRQAVCRGCGGPVGGIAEERLHQGARDTGADVQRGAGVSGREGVLRREAAEVAGGSAWNAGSLKRNGRLVEDEEQGRWQQVHQKRRRLANCESGWRDWRPTLRPGGCGRASGRRSCGGSGITSKANDYASHEEWLRRTGGMLAVMSSSCWAAGMKRRDASYAWQIRQ